jgi:hypothetical protein
VLYLSVNDFTDVSSNMISLRKQTSCKQLISKRLPVAGSDVLLIECFLAAPENNSILPLTNVPLNLTYLQFNRLHIVTPRLITSAQLELH